MRTFVFFLAALAIVGTTAASEGPEPSSVCTAMAALCDDTLPGDCAAAENACLEDVASGCAPVYDKCMEVCDLLPGAVSAEAVDTCKVGCGVGRSLCETRVDLTCDSLLASCQNTCGGANVPGPCNRVCLDQHLVCGSSAASSGGPCGTMLDACYTSCGRFPVADPQRNACELDCIAFEESCLVGQANRGARAAFEGGCGSGDQCASIVKEESIVALFPPDPAGGADELVSIGTDADTGFRWRYGDEYEVDGSPIVASRAECLSAATANAAVVGALYNSRRGRCHLLEKAVTKASEAGYWESFQRSGDDNDGESDGNDMELLDTAAALGWRYRYGDAYQIGSPVDANDAGACGEIASENQAAVAALFNASKGKCYLLHTIERKDSTASYMYSFERSGDDGDGTDMQLLGSAVALGWRYRFGPDFEVDGSPVDAEDACACGEAAAQNDAVLAALFNANKGKCYLLHTAERKDSTAPHMYSYWRMEEGGGLRRRRRSLIRDVDGARYFFCEGSICGRVSPAAPTKVARVHRRHVPTGGDRFSLQPEAGVQTTVRPWQDSAFAVSHYGIFAVTSDGERLVARWSCEGGGDGCEFSQAGRSSRRGSRVRRGGVYQGDLESAGYAIFEGDGDWEGRGCGVLVPSDCNSQCGSCASDASRAWKLHDGTNAELCAQCLGECDSFDELDDEVFSDCDSKCDVWCDAETPEAAADQCLCVLDGYEVLVSAAASTDALDDGSDARWYGCQDQEARAMCEFAGSIAREDHGFSSATEATYSCWESHLGITCNSGQADQMCWCEVYDPCFPGASMLLSEHRGRVRMDDVHVGDRVASVADDGSIEFSEVIMLPHRHATAPENDRRTRYVVLETASGHVLRLTGNHFLFAGKALANDALHEEAEATFDASLFSLTYARDVAPGDWLFVRSDDSDASSSYPAGGRVVGSRVVQVGVEVIEGAYGVITRRGRVLVDGVAASSYANTRWEAVSYGAYELAYDLGAAAAFQASLEALKAIRVDRAWIQVAASASKLAEASGMWSGSAGAGAAAASETFGAPSGSCRGAAAAAAGSKRSGPFILRL